MHNSLLFFFDFLFLISNLMWFIWYLATWVVYGFNLSKMLALIWQFSFPFFAFLLSLSLRFGCSTHHYDYIYCAWLFVFKSFVWCYPSGYNKTNYVAKMKQKILQFILQFKTKARERERESDREWERMLVINSPILLRYSIRTQSLLFFTIFIKICCSLLYFCKGWEKEKEKTKEKLLLYKSTGYF